MLGHSLQAEDAPKQAPQKIDGKSLASPAEQRAADEAQHTTGGGAGRDEPGAHLLTQKGTGARKPLLKDGKSNVPGAPTQSQTAPAAPSGTAR
jgi:hypothetical protein